MLVAYDSTTTLNIVFTIESYGMLYRFTINIMFYQEKMWMLFNVQTTKFTFTGKGRGI